MASLLTIPWASGGLQGFTYDAGLPYGLRQGVLYLTELGPLATQEFSYDYIVNTFAATLLEDSDGILPAGSGTCDLTPTIQWTAPTGSVGPFLYSWVLQNNNVSGSTVASGITVNVNSVTLPAVSPGIYYTTISATGAAGSEVNSQALIFQVLDCKFLTPTKATIISPFDIEPVIPQDGDYIRYLPRWMALYGTATAAPSSSTTFKFFQPLLKELRKVNTGVDTVERQFTITNTPLNLPRKAWHLQTRYNTRDIISITCVASGITNDVRRETSFYNFLTAIDPVFILGDNGHIAFRNLAQRDVVVSPVSGSASGALQYLATQYKMPFEHEGIVPDSDVLFFFDGVEYKIRAGSNGVDPDQAIIQLTSPFSGDIRFIYQSKTLAPVVTISISGNPFISPSPTDLWNKFDEFGLVSGLQRRDDEDNITLHNRIYSRFISGQGTTAEMVAQHISQDLTLVDVITWDGVATVDLSGSQQFGVKYFTVLGLPQTDFANEQLIRMGSSYQKYTASKSNWKAGYQIFVNGRPVTKAQYPGLSINGNIVDFGTNVSGTVSASYTFDNYIPTKSSVGTILSVSPASGNAVSGSYTVVLSKNINVHTAADEDYIRNNLSNPNGTPNSLFYLIANNLLENSPIHFGRARWGPSAFWLEETDQKPLTEHLPSIFDIITGY